MQPRPRKLLLDVGGHIGETVESALDPIYGFDAIYSFEPVVSCANRIREIKDRRVHVIAAGLSNYEHEAPIYGAGGEGASVYGDAPDAVGQSEICQFLDASRWFREHVMARDVVYMKLNCEGSECDVLNNLLDSGEYGRTTQVLIDFDARKVPSQKHRVEELKQRLKESKFYNYSFPEEMQYGGGSHFGGIRKWLNLSGARQNGVKLQLQSLAHHLSNVVHQKHLPFYKLKILGLTPPVVVKWYYSKLKRSI